MSQEKFESRYYYFDNKNRIPKLYNFYKWYLEPIILL